MSESRGGARLAAALLAAFVPLHAVQVHGYWRNYWDDPGQVLHQLERFAHGEALYRDVFVTSPPLGYWVIGTPLRWLGTDPARVEWVTGMLFALVVACWWRWARALLAGAELLALPACVLACALVGAQGVALPLGTYSPGAPVGFLCLLLALLASGTPPRAPTALRGLAAGVACAGCVLAKQDFWAPAAFVAVSLAVVAWRARAWRGLAAAFAAGAACLAGGLALVAASVGWASLPLVATGYGVAGESGFGRSAPTWDRLTLQGLTLVGLALAATAATAAVGWRRALRWAAALAGAGCALLAIRAAASFEGSATRWLAGELHGWLIELAKNPLPALTPVGVALLVHARTRRASEPNARAVLWLLGLCIAARVRRGFECTEWFQVLLEVPAYALAARVLAPTAWRSMRTTALVALSACALFSTWRLGDGVGTQRGALPRFETKRGVVHFTAGNRESYAALRDLLDRVDPSGKRPVFAFGHSGGYAYWLRRPNPTPLTFGFAFSPIPPAEAVQLLRSAAPPVFLIRSPAYDNSYVPTTDHLLRHWSAEMRLNAFAAGDRPWFARAAQGCVLIRVQKPLVFDCAPLGAASQVSSRAANGAGE